MKIFLMNEQASVTSPILMHQAYKAIQNLQVQDEDQQRHDEFLGDFTRLTLDQINKKVDDIIDESEEYGSKLAEIIKSIIASPTANKAPRIIDDPVQDQYLKEFEGEFGQYKEFTIAKEALYKKNALGASQPIRALIGNISENHHLQQQFIAMYSSIVKALPDFQIALSDEQIFSAFAPIQLKNTLSELFSHLKNFYGTGPEKRSNLEELKEDMMLGMQKDGASSKIISDLLGKIFIEDARFNQMLCRYLTESSAFAEVVRAASSQIKTLKRLQQEHLEKASSQITSDEKYQQVVSDFMTVNIDMDLEALQIDLGKRFLYSKKLQGKTTTLVLYDFIKKRCNFENFIALISQNSTSTSEEMPFTQQFLLSYLLKNSDTYLRTMILTTCSYFMPLPLVTYQPKNQKYISIQPNNNASMSGSGKNMPIKKSDQEMTAGSETQREYFPFVFEELFYCFEKYMAVLAFKVSANPNKSPQGCTSLTNFVFNRTFQTHSKSMVNYGSIEIQFDYNFEHPMFVPVADAHGLVEDDILERVFPLFNIFMIHTFVGRDHLKLAQKQITKILQATKNPLIFLIIYDENRQENDFTTSNDGDIVQISLGRYNNLLEIPRANLRTQIVKRFLQYIGDYKVYQTDISARLKSLEEFSDFANRFRAYRNQFIREEFQPQEVQGGFQEQIQLQEGLDIVKNFMKLIEENKENLRSEQVLTLNVLFEEACRLEKILFRDTSLKSEDCEKHRLKVDQLYNTMRKSKPTLLTQELKKIIDHQNYLGLTSIISKFIRSFLELHQSPFLRQREILRTEIQKPNLDPNVKDEKLTKIKEITKTLEKRHYSNEFLYREYYISELSKYKGSEKLQSQSFTDYLTLCKLQIQQGQPFEIIDGNNLQFIKEVYQRIQDDRRNDEKILVVSVIGPQSSGKSLLLNTLFGAQFLSSEGRCTRGVYGCLIDIKCSDFKKILVLDTEGIQSTEAIDEAFDKRIIFYILCVSHVVLICNKGEMNKSMEDTIKLATDCILQVKEKIDMQPQVNIIMNNVKINVNSLYQAIQSLSNAILEMKSLERQKQIFTIDESNVFLLPNAFAQSGKEGFSAYQPSYQFAEKVDQLRKRILKVMKSHDGDIASHTLESWFKFAQAFWEFTDGYTGLTDYSTLEERKEDILLVEFSNKLIYNHFEEPESVQKHEKKVKEEATRVIDQHQGFDQTNINVIKKKIDDILRPLQREVEMKMLDELSKFTDDKGIRPQIKKRRYEQLETQIKQHLFNWQHIVQQLLIDFNETKSKFVGDKSLQNAIDKIIKGDFGQFNVQEAGDHFEFEWTTIENQLRSQFKTDEQIEEEQFRDIGNLYMQNARKIRKVDEDRTLLTKYNKSQRACMLKHLRSQLGFFYFNSKTIKPSIELFRSQIGRQKHLIKNIQVQFFEEQNIQNYYNWYRVVDERFIFSELQRALIEAMGSKQYYLWGQRKPITQNTIDDLIKQIQDEGLQFSVSITDEFKTILQQLVLIDHESDNNELHQKKGKQMKQQNQNSEKNVGVQAIQKCVDCIKQRIAYCFKYKKVDVKTKFTGKAQFFSLNNKGVNQSHREKEVYQYHVYKDTLDPRNSQQYIGLEPVDKEESYFRINQSIKNDDYDFYLYLEFLVKSDQSHIALKSPQVERAIQNFYEAVDYEELLKIMEKNVLDNIFKIKDKIKYTSVENLVQDLAKSENPNITRDICAMDFKVIKKMASTIEDIVIQINEEMEPYCLRVSESGRDCLHQITQTQIIRIMQEVIRLTERAPLFTLNQTKKDQKELFIAKLTSNDKKMDLELAQNTGKHLAQIILKDLKSEQIKDFQMKIQGEQNLFKLKTIVSNIENQIEQIADGILDDPFVIDESQIKDGESWWSIIKRFIGFGGNQEEEMKEESINKMSKFKKVDGNFEFTPEEIIMFYVNPRQFLKNKFQNQWTQITSAEFQKAKNKYAEGKEAIKLKFQQYFESFIEKIDDKEIQLATNVFIPEGHEKKQEEVFVSQIFKASCQKAMGIYLGLVVTQQWKNGTPIQVDNQTTMIHPEALGLVTHENIVRELPQRYASILQKDCQNQPISNIRNFITDLMSVMQKELGPEKEPLEFVDLVKNLYQEMETKTLGCNQMCPLCRRQCDKNHDNENPEDRIHSCNETGHQIQGFGGNKHKMDDFAITFGCHELDQNDRVTWQGTELKWEIFKNKIFTEKKWSLDDQGGAKQAIKEKNVKIWNKIGPFICEYYQKVEKFEVMFQIADAASKKRGTMQRINYILMLDKSGSMTLEDPNHRTRWENLKSAVSSFIKKYNDSIQNRSKVSIITYNDEAYLEIESQMPPHDILDSVDIGGGTDFNAPLHKAKELMDKNHNSFDCFILVMMSDGEASHPADGIEEINKSPGRGKLKFKSIAYSNGSDSDTLTKMAIELGGSCDKCLEPSQLVNSFAEVITNPQNDGAQ